jgi:ornithine carbamoyltransferase
MKNLISIDDIDSDTLLELLRAGERIKQGSWDSAGALRGKVVGLYFSKPSTRTRTSFFCAVRRLGGDCISYGPGDLQLGNGESIADTGMTFGLYLNALVMRTNEGFTDMYRLAECSGGMPVINALSKEEHPTQAIADLLTVKEEFGTLAGKHILYVGAGNNTLGSLLLAAAKVAALRMTVITPERFALDKGIVERAIKSAAASGATLEVHHNIGKLPRAVDVVYTTRWESMGEEPQDPGWRANFAGFKVTNELLRRVASDTAIVMHDLPANRGSEVDSCVLDGTSSRIRRQAFNKMISAMVTLQWCIPGQNSLAL